MDYNEHLQNIDQLSEGYDWFLSVNENDITAAKRIKATPTSRLMDIVEKETNEYYSDFACKELIFRAATGLSETSTGVVGFDKLDTEIHEKLTSADPAEKWIADFVKSDNPNFDGKTKKERINMALGAYYASKKKEESISEKRDLYIVKLSTGENDNEDIMRFFIESKPDVSSNVSTLTIKDLYEEFVFDLTESSISRGSVSTIKCIKEYEAFEAGINYEGVWLENKPNQLQLHIEGFDKQPVILFNTTTKTPTIQPNFELI